jgi:uncharacterized protein YbjT (DUF2867 family)
MILVIGLTGRLRPVVDELLARGLEVRVTARDADAPHARELAARGAAIAPADLEDAASLRAALHDVDVVLAAGAPHRAGAAGERRHGINVAQAVAQTGDAHLVFFSGEGADQATGVPVLDAKHAVERRIRELGLTHTILAPVYLMQNAFNPWNVGALSAGRFALALPPDRALQQLAIEDLASVAATVAVRPAAFAGERIALAGDELTGDEAAAALSRVTGRPFAFHEVARDGLAPGMRLLFDWLERLGHHVDIPALRRRFPEVRWQRFEEWAAARDWPERRVPSGGQPRASG